MTKIVLTVLLPLLAPTLLYLGYLFLQARLKAKSERGEPLPPWSELPWTWLILSGSALAAIGLIWLASGGFDPEGAGGGTFESPRFIDGEIVPGGRVEDGAADPPSD